MISRIIAGGSHGVNSPGKVSPGSGSSPASSAGANQPVFDLASLIDQLTADGASPQSNSQLPTKKAPSPSDTLQQPVPDPNAPRAQTPNGSLPPTPLLPMLPFGQARASQSAGKQSNTSSTRDPAIVATSVAPHIAPNDVLPFALSLSIPPASMPRPDFAQKTGLNSTSYNKPNSPAALVGVTTANPVTPAAQDTAQPLQPNELAFSARISPHDSSSASSSKLVPETEKAPGEAAIHTVTQAMSQNLTPSVAQSLAAEPLSSSGNESSAGFARDYQGSAFPAAAPISPAKSDRAITGVASAEIKEPVSAPAPPLREIVLQVPGARSVEVKVTESAGQLKVDVRSGDPALTHDLRSNLRDLVSGLDRKGFTAEITHTDGSTAGAALQASDTGSFKDSHKEGAGERSFDQREQPGQRKGDEEESGGRPSRTRAEQWQKALDAQSS